MNGEADMADTGPGGTQDRPTSQSDRGRSGGNQPSERFLDDVAAYLLDALPDLDRERIAQRIEQDVVLRQEAAELLPIVRLLPDLLTLTDADALPAATSDLRVAPSFDLRDRIINAAQADAARPGRSLRAHVSQRSTLPADRPTGDPAVPPVTLPGGNQAPDRATDVLGDTGRPARKASSGTSASGAVPVDGTPTLPSSRQPVTEPSRGGRGYSPQAASGGRAPRAPAIPLLAGLLLLVVMAFGAVAFSQQVRINDLNDEVAQVAQERDIARSATNATVWAFAPNGQEFTGATGTLFYSARDDVVTATLRGLPATDENEVYQLWILRGEQAPIPAGLFSEDDTGLAYLYSPDLELSPSDAVAVSIEPAGGSDEATGPTGPIPVVGTVGAAG